MFPLFLIYLFVSAVVASVSIHKKWRGLATFCLLFFVWVLFAVYLDTNVLQ